MKMAKVMVVAAAVALVSFAANAYGGEGWKDHKNGDEGQRRFDKMAEDLGLTTEQKASLEKQHEATMPQMKALREKMRASREQLKAELDKDTPDKAKLAALVEEMKTLTGEQVQMRIDKVLEMKKILTPEQSAKMKSIMDAKKKEFETNRKDKDGRGPPPDDF